MKVNRIMKPFLMAAAGVGLVCLMASAASAASMTGICSKCHTMHNSQNNVVMTTLAASTTPNAMLLKTDCVGCHSGSELTAATNTSFGAPIVIHTASPNYYDAAGLANNDTLAGGDFWWVSDAGLNTDSMGHNVPSVSGADVLLTAVPGSGDIGALTALGGGQVNCYGSTGTGYTPGANYGCHRARGHHNNQGGDFAGAKHGFADGTSVGSSYRFLSGVKGYESDDWEYDVNEALGTANHNQYEGDSTTLASTVAGSGSMSAFCAECHGKFHGGVTDTQDGAGNWIRHPTDGNAFDAETGEYAAYTSYDMLVPVAADNSSVTIQNPAAGTGTGGGGTSATAVSCLSCHRAHGSPYADLLRWSYSGMDAGTATAGVQNTGCFRCHSTKDAG